LSCKPYKFFNKTVRTIDLISFVLIGLGILILLDSQTLLDPTLTVIALLVSSFALMSLSKNKEQLAEAQFEE
jgi:hypothetical protein